MAIESTVMHSYQLGVGFLKQLCGDLEADKLAQQPKPGMNHPLWIVGHLVTTMGFASQLAGGSYEPPKGWDALFGMNSKPLPDAGKYPAPDELFTELDNAVQVLAPTFNQLDEDAKAAQTPDDGFRKLVPTIGDSMTFILVSHLWMHIGQLSAWRRACGMPPLF